MIPPEISHDENCKSVLPMIKIWQNGSVVLSGEEFIIELKHIKLKIKGDLVEIERK